MELVCLLSQGRFEKPLRPYARRPPNMAAVTIVHRMTSVSPSSNVFDACMYVIYHQALLLLSDVYCIYNKRRTTTKRRRMARALSYRLQRLISEWSIGAGTGSDRCPRGHRSARRGASNAQLIIDVTRDCGSVDWNDRDDWMTWPTRGRRSPIWGRSPARLSGKDERRRTDGPLAAGGEVVTRLRRAAAERADSAETVELPRRKKPR